MMLVYDIFANEIIDEKDMSPYAPPERYFIPKTEEAILYLAGRFIAQEIEKEPKEAEE